ncbi:hypothetical protein [Tunicatimonas pelagia]|uniref:hypothetical protein n=1 Tax=Tunicatimonas pelagia TaxID=931531 RepID=UPI0026658CDE|nr:hypothetical protein [Tunicatimonas pelagia]WKN41014.1 hypothetical protein P0M28_18430 [Tunicatimonas pelagia]
MKYIIFFLTIVSIMGYQNSVAQNPLSQNTQVEVNVGWVTPFLQSGSELMRAENLRDNGQSYFAGEDGNRREVGDYSSLSGISFGIGFYKPTKVKGLMLGAVVRNAQTGSTPEQGEEAEAYYFNFLTAGAAAKYYPFTENNLFLRGEVGLGAVWTKNRFLAEGRDQQFFHQFGIGSAGSIGLGYTFTPFKNSTAIELQTVYQQLSTRVEVNGIGDDTWRFGALNIGATIIF